MYCHECAEMQLRHAFVMKNIHYPLVSDPQNCVFKILIEEDNTLIIDVRTLKLEHVGVCVDTCKDWNLFINFIDDQLKLFKL